MSEKDSPSKRNMKICLLGASFKTGNMGVSALAESSIKIILNYWPDAEITLLGVGYTPCEDHYFISGREICIKTLPIRFSKNIFLQYHFLVFLLNGLLSKVLHGSSLKRALEKHNAYYKNLCDTDLAVDITGGDSFSDIYGFRRFFLGFLCKWLVIFMGKKYVLLPQTYGPFNRCVTKIMAKYILKQADMVYSRDFAGVDCVNRLIGKAAHGQVAIAPDVAFVLDARKPECLGIEPNPNIRSQDSIVVGLNISGLLFNGGYTQDNMFGLKTNYRDLICRLIEMFLEDKNIIILLTPHVFPPIFPEAKDCEVESDLQACMKVYEEFNQKYPGRMSLARGHYNHNEIKYIIGLCDFFIGSRMHACIAALSQSIPAVGLAYSGKFLGVFASLGIDDLAIDLKAEDESVILSRTKDALLNRDKIAEELRTKLPAIQEKVLSIFENVFRSRKE